VNNTFRTFIATLLLGASLALAGCGGGGGGSSPPTYKGNTAVAKVDATNAEALGTASGEATQQAGSGSNLPIFASISSTGATDLEALSQKIIAQIRDWPLADLPTSFSLAGSCGGSVNGSDSALPASGPYSITINYNNYCDSTIDATLAFTGKVIFTVADVNDFGVFSMQFINFKVTFNGETTTLNATMSCTDFSCTIFSDFKSSTGDVHRVADISISGDASNGFNGSMTFYHVDYGYVTVTVTGVTFGNCGAFPDGGSVRFDGVSGSTGSIIFASDCSYTGTYDDGAGGTGGFSGSTK